MRVAVTGASGLLGQTLVPMLTTGAHEVAAAVRDPGGEPRRLVWSVERGIEDPARWEGLDGVVHLAGENIAERRWTVAQKERIRRSRVEGTRRLSESLSLLSQPPRVAVIASAIGYYGSRGDERLTEESRPGSGFLPEVCQHWEAAAEPLRAAGTRVVHARFGIILSPRGGALQKMLLPFRLGMGGRVGSGRQYWSWVSIDDAAAAILHALMTDSLAGPVNVVAPQSVTNAEFTATLGRVLHRPTWVPMPAFAARLALGEMADALLLASARVQPQRLEQSGFTFRHAQLETTLRALLGH
jgi:uncharacterized protein (TIGR01777 family)